MKIRTSTSISPLVLAATLFSAGAAHADLFEPTALAQTADGRWVEEYTYTLYPGESVPWHFHPGPLAIVLASGSLTEDRGCGVASETHAAGTAFTEDPGVVHAVANNGAEPAVLLISGVVPSCYGGFNDALFVDAPRCEGSSQRAHVERVPACAP